MTRQLDAERLRAVVETAADGVILIDDQGRILMFNPACERLFGYAVDEVRGENVRLLMPEPYRSGHDGYLQHYREGGAPRIIGIGREVEGRRKDGTTFPMHLSVGEARQGGGTTFVGIVHDLTERKQAERALRESEARLRAVVETAVDGVILIDDQGRIAMFNPACERMFGYTADEVQGQNVKLLMPEPYRDEHDGYLEHYRKGGEARIIGIGREVEGRHKDGTTFPMHLSVGEARRGGQMAFVGIIHDLTEHKRTQEQLVQAQKMETVGQLAGGIAHDFNNLLTVVIGNAEELAGRLRARPDLEELAQSILHAGTRGAELTRHLLAFSRRQTLQPSNIDCTELIRAMEHIVRRTLAEDIAVVTHLDPALAQAVADASQLQSALLNLVLNARDAMPGGGTITVSATNIVIDEAYRHLHPEVAPGDYVMIAVSDDGQGMSAETRERAVEPFFTTKAVGRGSGLGLSMVYGFVKQSSGHLSLYSEEGLGTCVRLYLPAVADGGDAATRQRVLGPDEKPQQGSETVLVVEDDPFVRGHALSCLQSLGYAAIAAVDGHEALAHLTEARPIHVLFTDVVMPGGIDGFELADQARRLRPDIKVLMTSGYAADMLRARGRLPDEAVLLDKPYRRVELASRLRQVIES